MSSQAWQQPFVNIFKHYGAGEWKKCTKVGEVNKIMDRSVKSSVYRISGPIPSGNYIQFPKSSSLGLTGHIFYLLFKPVVDKCFSVHIDVAASDGVLVRISLSNLFKEFKSSSTWLQFPVIANPPTGSVEEATTKDLRTSQSETEILPSASRWTLVCMDVQYVLSVYLNKHFAHFKSIRLCSNMIVKNVFTSTTCYEPGLDIKFARKTGLLASGVVPLPSEMSFPLEKHEDWHQKYDYIKFPADAKTSVKVPRKKPIVDAKPNKKMLGSLRVEEKHSGSIPSTAPVAAPVGDMPTSEKIIKELSKNGKERRVLKTKDDTLNKVIVQNLPAVGLDSSIKDEENHGIHVYAAPSKKEKENKTTVVSTPKVSGHLNDTMTSYHIDQSKDREDSKVHVYAAPKQTKQKRDKMKLLNSFNEGLSNASVSKKSFLLPDPILRLKKVVGFGGGTQYNALWSPNGDAIIYPCYGIVVIVDVKTGTQNFLLGHNANVLSLALSDDNVTLASAQEGVGSVIRLWNFTSRKCLTVFKSTINDVDQLSFSKGCRRLCGVGKDSNLKQVIVVWNVNSVKNGGKISIVAKAHTESSFCLINCIKFVSFDDERLVSCGSHNIRIWRIKSNVLRSCPVDLGQHADIQFTDFCFHSTAEKLEKDASQAMIFFTASNGWVYKVNYQSLKVTNMKKLTNNSSKNQGKSEGMSLNCIDLSEHFCAVGSDDGFLRLWPLTFKSVFLEAEHDSPVTVVAISSDLSKVFAGTKSGNLGFLDITSRVYTTITRSHSNQVSSFSFNRPVHQIATISEDNMMKLWDGETLRQVFDFQASNEKPSAVCCHPLKAEFMCGFKSGTIRLFSLTTSSLLYELKEHLGSVHSLLFHPSGGFFYSGGSDGSLVMYEPVALTGPYTPRRTLPENVNKESVTCHTLALDPRGRYLAAIGVSAFLVSIYEANSLDELLRIDITTSTLDRKSSVVVDEAVALLFSHVGTTLLVATSTSRMLKLDCSTGQVLSQISHIHRGPIRSFTCSADGKYLATAGDQCIKVWDYMMEKELNFQVFIGHCSPISRLEFSPDGRHIISVGESLFMWDFLAERSVVEMDQPDIVIDKNKSSVGDQMQIMQPAHVPPPPIEQLRILELSSMTKPEEDSIVIEPDVISDTTNSLRDEDSVDFVINQEVDNPLPLEVIDLESEQDVPVVTVIDEDDCNVDIIATHTHPQVSAHYSTRKKFSRLAERCYAAPIDQAGIRLEAVVGCDSAARRNVVWHPETGLFMYTSGCLLVVEDLESGEQNILQGHIEDISSIGMRNDGQVVATGGTVQPHAPAAAPQIFIWNLTTRCCSMVLEKHSSSIVSLQYSRDDRFLVSVSDFRDCSFVVWCAKDYFILNERRTLYPVHAILWNPFVVNELGSVGRTECLLFWNLEDDKLKYDLEAVCADVPRDVFPSDALHKDMTSMCYLSAHILFTGSSVGVVCVWNLKTKHCMMHWQADDTEIDVLAVKPGKLITGSLSKRLRVWTIPVFDKMTEDGDLGDLESCAIVMEEEKELDGGIVTGCFDDDLEMGVVSTLNGTIWYITFEGDACIHIVSGHHDRISNVAMCSGDSRYLATSSEDGSLRLWNLETREQTAQFLVVGQECNCVTFCSRPLESLAASKSEYNQIIHPVTEHKQHPSQCIAGYTDGTVRMFDFGRMEKLLKMKPHSSPVVKLLCPIDGRVIISGSMDGLLAVSSLSTGLTIRVLNDHTGASICQLAHQKGSYNIASLLWLATSNDCRISVWKSDWTKDVCEMTDWITFPSVFPSQIQSKNANPESEGAMQCVPTLAMFSGCDQDLLIYTGHGIRKEICFYNLSKRSVVKTVSLSEWAFCMDLSPSGNLLALGFRDRLLKLVDASLGTFQDFSGHSDTLVNVRFTSDGGKVITSAGSELLIWEVLL